VSYTTLRVTDSGVVLFEAHRARLHNHRDFDRFAAQARPGNYMLQVTNNVLHVTPFGISRLFDGIPCRCVASPVAHLLGLQVKTASPSAWSSIRISNMATLLSSRDGTEIFESCSASLLCFDGDLLISVPETRPRIRSTAEHAIKNELPFAERPIFTSGMLPFVLVNAVAGVVTPEQSNPPLQSQVEILRQVLVRSTRRP
jgi:hypothetical protein